MDDQYNLKLKNELDEIMDRVKGIMAEIEKLAPVAEDGTLRDTDQENMASGR